MLQFTLKQLLCAFIGFAVGCAGLAMPLQHFDAAEEYGFAVYAIAGAGLSGAVGILVKKAWQGIVLGAVAGIIAWLVLIALDVINSPSAWKALS